MKTKNKNCEYTYIFILLRKPILGVALVFEQNAANQRR